MSQSVDVAELAFAIEDLLRPLARDAETFGEGAEEFDNLSNVVVVFPVLGAGLRVEEVVTCDELEYLRKSATAFLWPRLGKIHHACHAPHIRAGTPLSTQDNFWRAVLSCLNVVREMMANPASVAEISNLH